MAPAVHAQVRIGGDLTTPPANTIPTGPAGLTAAETDVTVPFDGVITRWRVGAGMATTPVRLRILRPGTPGIEVRRSDEVSPAPNWISVYAAQIPVAEGDRIALECCANDAAGAFFTAGGNAEVWIPPIGNNAEFEAPTRTETVGVALNADVEHDRDGDLLGDDTQDPDDDNDGLSDDDDLCPRVAGPASGCPAPPATPPPPRVNTPATVRFATPLVGTTIGPSQLIQLEVFDDFGAPTVTVFDDDGTVCALSGPPYSCTWHPTGADVGRATLLASAVDADRRSSLGSVRVRVAKFEADLTSKRRGRKVTGRLVLPQAVEKALGCQGEVTVRRKKVRRTVALKRNCTFSVRLPPGNGKPKARFAGNSVVEPAT
jgi:hypothetical protein